MSTTIRKRGGRAYLAHQLKQAAKPMPAGWPAPELMQDDCRKLFLWFASRPGARFLVRQALAGSPQERRE